MNGFRLVIISLVFISLLFIYPRISANQNSVHETRIKFVAYRLGDLIIRDENGQFVPMEIQEKRVRKLVELSKQGE